MSYTQIKLNLTPEQQTNVKANLNRASGWVEGKVEFMIRVNSPIYERTEFVQWVADFLKSLDCYTENMIVILKGNPLD